MRVTVSASGGGGVDDRESPPIRDIARRPTFNAYPLPQLRIELGAKRGDDPACLLLGEAAQQERLICERKAGREVLGKDHGRSGVDQRRHVPIVGGADH